MKNKIPKFIYCHLVLLATLFFSAGQAQSESSIWEGVYTQEQASRGEATYSANCASCHAGDLRGNSNTPSLLGMSFMFIWEGQSLGQLYTKMRDEMPSDRPGSLSSQTYADLLAFLLSSNQFPTGMEELTGDTAVLDKISITSQ